MQATYRNGIALLILLAVGGPVAQAAGFLFQSVEEIRAKAEKGDTDAQREMGWRYYMGDGVTRDYNEAAKWYGKAAKSMHSNAAQVVTNSSTLDPRPVSNDPKSFVPDVPELKPWEIYSQRADDGAFTPSVSGTGFFITEDGFLITSEHVIRGARQIQVAHQGNRFRAKIVKADAANDLALLKAEGKFPSIPVASSRGTGLGAGVFIVGFPNVTLQGFAPKFAKGEIASLSGAQDDPKYFQISVPVQPGNSGGALIDQHGNAVGVIAAKLNLLTAVADSGAIPENVNYAVKSSFLLSFLEALPDVSTKLKEPNTKDQKFEEAVKSAELAAVLVLCQESPKLPNFSTLRARTTVPETPEPRYVGDHNIESILDDGNYVKMDDGSLWEVSPGDSGSSSSWTESSEVTVIRVDNSSYPYKLLNTDDNESVRARLVK